MFIQKSSNSVELMARARYFFLHYVQHTTPRHVEYHNHRWFKRDQRGQVIKVARTYFEIMQPY